MLSCVNFFTLKIYFGQILREFSQSKGVPSAKPFSETSTIFYVTAKYWVASFIRIPKLTIVLGKSIGEGLYVQQILRPSDRPVLVTRFLKFGN